MSNYKQLNFSGITENIREQNSSRVSYAENVVLEKQLVSQVANDTKNVSNYNTAFNIVKLIESSGIIYGLGQNNTTDLDTSLYSKSVGVANNWSLVTNGTIASTVLNTTDPFFVKLGSGIYFDGGNNNIAKYSGTTMTANWSSLAVSGGMSGGIVWNGDMYGHYGGFVYKISPVTGITTQMIAIPTEQTITQLIPYGNYIAIVCSSSVTESKMYLWDGITTTTFTDIVPIGKGRVSGGHMLEGTIHVVLYALNRKYFKIMRYYNNVFTCAYHFASRPNRAQTYSFVIPSSVVKSYDSHIYFAVSGTRSDSELASIYELMVFRYGRVSPEDNYGLSIWKTLDSTATNNGLLLVDGGNEFVIYDSLTGQIQNQFISAVLPEISGAHNSNYYESSSIYSTSVAGVIETTKFIATDSSTQKGLVGITCYFDPMPSTGQIVLKYKKDAETLWTTVFTDTTVANISHSCMNIEASGLALPDFKEIQFRFELTGGAKLTGYEFDYSEKKTKPY